MDVRKKFFTIWVMRRWHGLPGEVLVALSLGTFGVGLGGLWAPVVAVGVPAHCRGVELDDLWGSLLTQTIP